MIPAIRQVCEVMSLLVLIISHLKPNMGIKIPNQSMGKGEKISQQK